MNEKWFALSLSEIENKLKTNAATGLSRKAARSRLSAKYGTLFSLPVRSPMSYLGEIVSDFAYIMLMIMSFLALCFGEKEMGLVSTVAVILNLAIAFVSYYRSQFFCDSLERLFLPRCKVVREGRLYSVNGADVVRGDVILLQAGDIVAADARLISSDKLRVKMLVEREKYILLDKAAESRVYENELDPKNFGNMVHAASVVVSGSARAIVTDVGQYTYVGAKMGNITTESKGRRRVPRLLSLFKSYCTRLAMILLIVVLPFSILSMLFGNDTLSLFTSFMTAIAIAASSMAQFSTTLCRAFYTTSMKKCLSNFEPSLVRSADVMDKLASTRYLFVLDGAMLTDGILHFESALTADGETSLSQGERVSASAKRLGELAALYESAQKTSLSVGSEGSEKYDGAIREFIEKSSADKGALGIRCNVTGFSAQNSSDPHDRLFYTEFGDKYMLSVSYSDSIINECTECLLGGGRAALSSEARASLMNICRRHQNAGKSVLVFSLCRHDGYGSFSEKCFVGMLVLSQRCDEGAREALDSLEKYGLMPIFFRDTLIDGVSTSLNVVPTSLVGEESVCAADFARRGVPISYGFGKFSVYRSLTDRQVCELIDAAHASGERVAVVGFDEGCERIYQKADLLVSFSSDEYKVKGSFETVIDVLHTRDDPARAEVCETQRRRADILIPRPDKKRGGGCTSLLSAFRGALLSYARATGFFRYTVCMQLVRMVLVMVPMLFGGTALDARHVVFGGMIADLFVMFSYITDTDVKASAAAYRSSIREMSAPIKHNAATLLCFAGSALVASVLPELISLLPAVPKFIDKTEYSLVLFVLFHIVVFICFKLDIRRENLDGIREIFSKKPRALTVIYPVFMVGFAILCFASQNFGNLFDVEGFSSIAYFFVSLLPPLIGAVLYFFFGAVKLNFKNSNPKNK